MRELKGTAFINKMMLCTEKILFTRRYAMHLLYLLMQNDRKTRQNVALIEPENSTLTTVLI